MKTSIEKLKDLSKAPYSLLLEADPSKEIVKSYLQRGDCYTLIHGDEIIGTFVLLPTRPETIELVNIAIAKDYQGKGFGKMLVKEALTQAKKDGYKTVELGTGNSSLSQLGLYQKCGFRIVGIDRDFFTKHYEEKIIENGIECKDMIRLSIDL